MDTEILFPIRLLPELKNMRSEVWSELIAQLEEMNTSRLEVIAFSGMMVKLNNCLTCHVDTFRAMKGCLTCSRDTVRRCKMNDQELLSLYEQTLAELSLFVRNEG